MIESVLISNAGHTLKATYVLSVKQDMLLAESHLGRPGWL